MKNKLKIQLPKKAKDHQSTRGTEIGAANAGVDAFPNIPQAFNPPVNIPGQMAQESSPVAMIANQDGAEIVGLLPVAGGGSRPSAGAFELPVTFDSKRYSARYVKEGSAVVAAGQREYLSGLGKTADGFAVWKDESGAPHKVTVADGTYVLMMRPLIIAGLVNQAFGDLSRSRMSSEKRGETIGGTTNLDSGMLTDDRLTREIGLERDAEENRETVMFGAPQTKQAERQLVSR